MAGPSSASDEVLDRAHEVGLLIAGRGGVVVTGGHGGVMEAASRGAFEAGGTTVGLLPGSDRAAGNQWLTVAIPTGLGELRNGLVVRACDALIACGGSWGTLSEVSLALRTGRPVISLGGWDLERFAEAADPDIPLPRIAASPEEAVDLALEAAAGS